MPDLALTAGLLGAALVLTIGLLGPGLGATLRSHREARRLARRQALIRHRYPRLADRMFGRSPFDQLNS